MDKIEYGEIHVPTSWDELTLKKYQEIERYYDDKEKQFDVRDIIHILIDKDMDFINSLPMEFLEIIYNKAAFLMEEPPEVEKTNRIVIDGEEYVINVMEKLKLGEYVAADMVIKNDRHDYASILAILCRKKGEVFDSKFEAELFEERKKMFEQQPVLRIFGITAFFLDLYTLSEIPSQLCMKVDEGLSHIANQLKNSTKIGGFKKLYMTWRIRKLRKSLKSIKRTLPMRSHT